MTGARSFTYGSCGELSFRLSIGKASHVKIALDPNDTYRVTFCRVRGSNVKTLAEVVDVYADNLRTVFEEHTGLATQL